MRNKLDELLEESKNLHVDTTKKIDKNTALTEQEVYDRVQDRYERKKYAFRTYLFLCGFTSIILLIIILSGFSKITSFNLNDSVLIALITSSLATIVGIFILVMRYLFK
ncbi:hypothetical protein PG911_18735 [Tenacibaculum ovolyticum]|uniref:hypothetical protein n=1 Tax=Tenacibaculum ovolyticum TaxID=104270 RepID=UPI0004248DA3|nr:hypothetical protein [Tenacibaculum ovolyticum]WBX76623.1 hypothetical protein PG911_18735 [Tenacibaculum ovolyticum]